MTLEWILGLLVFLLAAALAISLAVNSDTSERLKRHYAFMARSSAVAVSHGIYVNGELTMRSGNGWVTYNGFTERESLTPGEYWVELRVTSERIPGAPEPEIGIVMDDPPEPDWVDYVAPYREAEGRNVGVNTKPQKKRPLAQPMAPISSHGGYCGQLGNDIQGTIGDSGMKVKT